MDDRIIRTARFIQVLRGMLVYGLGLPERAVRSSLWPSRFFGMRWIAEGSYLLPAAGGSWEIRAGRRGFLGMKPEELARDFTRENVLIVGSGPSFNDFSEWGRVKGHLRIAVNGSGKVMLDRGMIPDLLVVTDRRFARECLPMIRPVIEAGAVLVCDPSVASWLAREEDAVIIDGRFFVIEIVNRWYARARVGRERLLGMGFHLPDGPVNPLCRIGWSDDILLGVFPAATVSFVALQIAAWLGAENVEFIGLDLGGKKRAYDETDGAQPSKLEADLETVIRPAFALALVNSKFNITNHSEVCPISLNRP